MSFYHGKTDLGYLYSLPPYPALPSPLPSFLSLRPFFQFPAI